MNHLINLIDLIDNQNINFMLILFKSNYFQLTNILMIKNHGIKKMILPRLNTILYVSLELIRKISILLYPIIPNNSQLKVLKIFNINENQIDFNSIKLHENIKKNDKINKISIMFNKIDKV